MSFNLIIPAAGQSSRMKHDLPKQFHSIQSHSILSRTLAAFSGFDVGVCVIPASKMFKDRVIEDIKGAPFPIKIVEGGETRAESVRNALNACEVWPYTLIHDAARPFVSKKLIQTVLDALRAHDCVIPGIPVSDTLKRVASNTVIETIDRSECVAVQTPQGFSTELLRSAYDQSEYIDLTDEAGLIEKMGKKVRVVDGDDLNIKITYRKDLQCAERYLEIAKEREEI
ncbi:2-C-methyl-D-erythritol 4-phosphate cytidylyltransferase [Candidatus Marinamargulisbacteria bacterium SCGC AG-343-D04]|nr:2-C-methyl-D-erythritol 4-phosphate cytidylyltransferase [Candidatus Marinamargulisbacteria bacterium SCGC AG-343-D04]RAP28703.1 2-C-methyl-D-erythritol 4-phosphate cytidylyltransferase [Candidatus Marinamargulisbacteria bacterium SCGC AG-343-D04]